MEQEILKKLEEQEKKIDLIYASVEKTRSYFLWTLILSVAFFVLPLVGLMFAIPFFLNTLSSAYGL
jgi:TRAP-type mannitol/chloroaromatic compound transport system permease small subunit